MDKQQLVRLIHKMCTDKKGFSLEAANEVVDYLASQKSLMFYYKCFICGQYHLTSKEPMDNSRAQLFIEFV